MPVSNKFNNFFARGMIDPSNQHLEWHSPPQNVLIIKKHHDQDVTNKFKEIVKWLMIVSQCLMKLYFYVIQLVHDILQRPRVQTFSQQRSRTQITLSYALFAMQYMLMMNSIPRELLIKKVKAVGRYEVTSISFSRSTLRVGFNSTEWWRVKGRELVLNLFSYKHIMYLFGTFLWLHGVIQLNN